MIFRFQVHVICDVFDLYSRLVRTYLQMTFRFPEILSLPDKCS